MHNLNIFEICSVDTSWGDVYWGLKNSFLDLGAVRDYALKSLELEINNYQEVSYLLSDTIDKALALGCIEEIMKKQGTYDSKRSIEKWKYCTIKYFRKEIIDFDNLVIKLEELYADFNYPKEMDEFISYMPVNDGYSPLKHTKNENVERILNKLDFYLEKKLEEIKN